MKRFSMLMIVVMACLVSSVASAQYFYPVQPFNPWSAPAPRSATQDYLCRKCIENKEYSCRKKNEMMGTVLGVSWARMCAEDCTAKCW